MLTQYAISMMHDLPNIVTKYSKNIELNRESHNNITGSEFLNSHIIIIRIKHRVSKVAFHFCCRRHHRDHIHLHWPALSSSDFFFVTTVSVRPRCPTVCVTKLKFRPLVNVAVHHREVIFYFLPTIPHIHVAVVGISQSVVYHHLQIANKF